MKLLADCLLAICLPVSPRIVCCPFDVVYEQAKTVRSALTRVIIILKSYVQLVYVKLKLPDVAKGLLIEERLRHVVDS